MTIASAELRVLSPGDEPKLFEFLAPYIDSSFTPPALRRRGYARAAVAASF